MREPTTDYIAGKIAALRTDPTAPASTRASAEAGLLPLFDDLAYGYYLKGDGTLHITDALEPEAGLQPVVDGDERIRVLRAAGDDDPMLLQLLPPRPHGFSDCGACGGTGRAWAKEPASVSAKTICLTCLGLGWVAASSA